MAQRTLVELHHERELAIRASVLRYRPDFLTRATSPDPTVRGAFFAVDSLVRALEGR